MFGFIESWFTQPSLPVRSAQDLSYLELIEELRTRDDIEIFARLRFRDQWVKNFHEKNPGAQVPSGFLMRFGALDRVASERMLKLMNELRVMRELPEISHEKLEKHLADSYPKSMR